MPENSVEEVFTIKGVNNYSIKSEILVHRIKKLFLVFRERVVTKTAIKRKRMDI